MKATGTNTASVVAAPATTAKAISFVPSSEARKALLPIDLWREMFSMMTVVASTTMPTASEMPIIDMLFIVIPIKYRTDMLPRRQTGMLMQAIIVARIVRRNTNMMSAVRIIEATMSPKTPFIERMMKRALSETTTSVVPTGAVLFSSAMRSCMRRESATSFAPRCLRMLTMMAGLPSYIDELRASSRPSSTRATSRRRITAPSRTAMGRYSSSAAEAYSPMMRMPYSFVPVSTRPAGSSTCLLYIASLISFVVMR